VCACLSQLHRSPHLDHVRRLALLRNDSTNSCTATPSSCQSLASVPAVSYTSRAQCSAAHARQWAWAALPDNSDDGENLAISSALAGRHQRAWFIGRTVYACWQAACQAAYQTALSVRGPPVLACSNPPCTCRCRRVCQQRLNQWLAANSLQGGRLSTATVVPAPVPLRQSGLCTLTVQLCSKQATVALP
jgi:hypothetical protein